MRKSAPVTLGIDIGGTPIKMGLVQETRILLEENIPTRLFSTPTKMQEGLVRMVRSLIQKSNHPVRTVGIGIPGLVRYPDGIVHTCANLPGWRDVPLKKLLQRRLRVPVSIDNDVNLMTLAEWIYGAGRGVNNLVCMTLGTGVGGGLVLAGRLYRGTDGWAGEIGHIPCGETGPRCSSGGIAARWIGVGVVKPIACTPRRRSG